MITQKYILCTQMHHIFHYYHYNNYKSNHKVSTPCPKFNRVSNSLYHILMIPFGDAKLQIVKMKYWTIVLSRPCITIIF